MVCGLAVHLALPSEIQSHMTCRTYYQVLGINENFRKAYFLFLVGHEYHYLRDSFFVRFSTNGPQSTVLLSYFSPLEEGRHAEMRKKREKQVVSNLLGMIYLSTFSHIHGPQPGNILQRLLGSRAELMRN